MTCNRVPDLLEGLKRDSLFHCEDCVWYAERDTRHVFGAAAELRVGSC